MQNDKRILELVGARATRHGATVLLSQHHADVRLSSGRMQRVHFDEDDTHVLFESVAVRRVAKELGAPFLEALILQTNYETRAAGFRRVDGNLVAFAKLLKETLDRGEAIEAILEVAREADRIEQVVTGRDDE